MSAFSLGKILKLLEKSNENGVNITFLDGELSVHVEKGKSIGKELLEELKANKPGLVHYFTNFASKGAKEHLSQLIPTFSREEVKKIPVSFSQERLWFIDQLEGSIQYHLPIILRLKGKVNSGALSHAFQNIINRHGVLRTNIREEDGQAFQFLKEKDSSTLNLVDGAKFREDPASLQHLIRSLVRTPFNLAQDDMVRADLVQLDEEDHVLVVVMHHIASDAWSTAVLVKEVAELYSAFIEEREAQLPTLRVQYADYAVWQRNYLQGEVLQKKLDYWKENLDGTTPLELPTDYPRPPVQGSRGASILFNVDKETSEYFYKLSQQQGTTLYMTLLAAFNILLYRYTGQNDISVGTSIASREQKELEGLIGFFVNTLVFRNEVKGDETYLDLLKQVRATTLGAYEHQDVSFEKVVDIALSERDPSRNPLFQVMLVLSNTPEVAELRLGELELIREIYEASISKFDMTFFVLESPGGFQGSVQYSTDLFTEDRIGKMIGHFKELLASIAKAPHQKIGLLPMLTKPEQELLESFNTAAVDYPIGKSVVDLFEEQAAKTPTATALVFENEKFSYLELNEKANQLAHTLRSHGVKENSLVPLYIERGIDMMTGMLGILKAGAAYVPIDTDFPQDRITYMLEDTSAKFIVSSSKNSGSLAVDAGVEIIETDHITTQDKENPLTKPLPTSLAYVIYTSGSTGKPKGVMITHRNLVDYYFGLNKYTQVDHCRSFALVSTIATDLGNTVIYGSLLSGGALHVFTKESVSNIELLHDYFENNRIDCLKIVPSHWQALSQDGKLLLPRKLLVFGGEALPAELVEHIRLSGSACQVVNHYGPTETTIGKLLHLVKPGNTYQKTIPIGKPFSNTRVYILTKELQPCPVGVPGQLYIAGDGVATGYFNNEALTKEKFIADPFAGTGLMYGTGDLVKYLPDGNILFIGRVDDQVKIRGYRIELGEIEAILHQNEYIRQAVVLAREDKQGNKRLIGYIITGEDYDKEALQRWLREKLPEYMVPAVLVEMESYPLTANGKIDRKSLPDPEAGEGLSGEYVAPRNEVEQKLATIWQDVLELEQVGVHDDFFELGGHSLLAVRLISAIRKAFTVEMPIGDIFDYPTVAQLAGQVAKQSGNEILATILPANPRPERIPLSFSQERLWFIHQLEGSLQYHVPAVLRLKGSLNKAALAATLQQIINRHEVLRSVYLQHEGHAYQVVKDIDEWQLTELDGSAFKNDKDTLESFIRQQVKAPFDLSKDYMLRAALIKIDEGDHVLVATQHHIASDGWSRSVLVKEFVELYSANEENRPALLPVLPLQYADYAIWQRQYLSAEMMEKKLAYWKGKLDNAAILQLPTDYNRPAVQSTKGDTVRYNIDKVLSDKLVALSQQHGATLFMTLLAAFKTLLYRYSGQTDICVGSGIAGRQQEELEGLIGFFVNTLVYRTEVNGDASFIELLQQVKRTTREAYENQEVPFEKVVDAVVKERSLSRNPLAQVLFALQNTPDVPQLKLGNLQLAKEGSEHTTARFDITFFVNETPNGLQGVVEYSTDLYHGDTLVRMIGHFKELLAAIVASPNQKIGLLPMVTTQEKDQLLKTFNSTNGVVKDSRTVIELFESIAKETPAAIAIEFGQDTISYKQLNERSNQLAHYLISKGITAETLVPVSIRRSPDLLISLLAILKSGGAYVPIDPGYPLERIRYMLEDSDARLIITNGSDLSSFGKAEVAVIDITNDAQVISRQPVHAVDAAIKPGQLANVIYTSGSTGKPKGVMIEHSGLVNLVQWHNKAFKVSAQSKATTMAGVGFDAFGWEIWPYLSIGASILIIDDETRLSPLKLLDILNHRKVTHSFMATALVPEFVQVSKKNVPSLQFLLTGGDKLASIDIEGASYKLVNNYGPTENSVVSTSYQLNGKSKEVTPSIGAPISNTGIYIVDKNDGLVPIGVAGEICISGAGLARGYLNRIPLTEEKFVLNPFITQQAKMYRTGDIGRWLPDGNIEYLGRKDEQVKIRGYRIELGEIENVLQQTGLVSQAVVLAKEIREGDKRLLGYFVPDWDIVKARELELYRTQIAGWKELYENEYAQTEDQSGVDVEFNIIGWNDSFTKEAIPAEQMASWVQDIVEVILSVQPRNVLEIGSGSGLIYYQLAGKVKKYIGTDFSKSSITQIAQHIKKGARDYGETELQVCAAHEIALKPEEQIDTIILNSIVQYFPGEDYMSTVIEKGISLLKGEGRIIIGDVRDNRLLKYFKGRLHLLKTQHSASSKEFDWAVDQEVLGEEELCFSPEYFYNLASVYPQITHIDIQWKQADYINELSLYRYTVILYVGIQNEIVEPAWKNWDLASDRQMIVDQLQQENHIIAIKDAPNPRLWKERQLGKALQNNSISTVAEIVAAIEKEDKETSGMNELLQVAISKGYHYRLLLDEDPLKVNILLELNPTTGFIPKVYGDNGGSTAGFNTNIPLFTDIMLQLQKELFAEMEQQLPDYMIPAELHALGKLPLTNNGKVDRNFLHQLAGRTLVNQLNYKEPHTAMEATLAQIWQTLLSIERVGIEDNFFSLGGHSLMVMRLISAVRRQLGLELAIKDLFLYPTIEQLAAKLQTQDAGMLLPPIEVQPRPKYIPLSFSQERLWFIDRLEGSRQYHIPAVLRLKGALRKAALEYALQTIINRHEVLRTVISDKEGKAYQSITAPDSWKLQNIDGTNYEHDSQALQSKIKQLVSVPFDLSMDPMLRATLIGLNDQEHILVVTMHHIASDGWSVSIIVKEFAELYNAYSTGSPLLLTPLQIQYADFSIWQRNYLQGELFDRKLNYWKERLSGVAPLQLPTDFTRPVVQSAKGASLPFRINKELSEKLQALSKQNGTTMFMTLLTCFKILLYRYSGQQDICVGTPVAGRMQKEVEELIGFFINTLALRTNVNGQESFTSLLQAVKKSSLDDFENQDVPFEKVVEHVVKVRDISRTPLFQSMFMLQNTPDVPELKLGDLTIVREGSSHTTTQFELVLNISENVNGMQGSLQYSTELYGEKTITKMIGHFNNLLQSVVANPLQDVGRLEILSTADKNQLLNEFNNTRKDFPLDKSLVDLFEEQVIKTPDAIAVVFEGEQLSYIQLNERSNQMAHYLVKRGVQQEMLVPVCMERSLEMIIGILGILKAGGAYVPIDPEYPLDRISYMLEDIAAKIILTTTESRVKLPSNNIDIIELDGHLEEISKEDSKNLAVGVYANQLAYVIYTSGSTGKPKGAMNEHRAVVNRLCWAQDYYRLTPADAILQKTTFSFDVSVWELVWPLLTGARLVFAKPGGHKDNNYLRSVIAQQKITVIHFVPSMLEVFLPDLQAGDCSGLKKVLCSGEALKPSQVALFKKKLPAVELHNLYGPTEAAIDVTYWSLEENADFKQTESIVPIGKPVANTSIYILDEANGLAPMGTVGEIHIGGVQVARGYLNQPVLTAEKFIEDPFGATGSTMYKTGDRGRWLPDGNIAYLGRKDDQVKIRGFRIELGEIEIAVQQSGLVKQCVVVASEEKVSGILRLAGYVVTEGGFDRIGLMALLKEKLPEYMVPAVWVELETLPLTPNGKIDKKALPNPDPGEIQSSEYIGPRNELETILVNIWQHLLQVERVGIHDNFFELGGHSLLTMRMVSAIENKISVSIPVNVLFQFVTINELSKYIEVELNVESEENNNEVYDEIII